MSDDYDDSDYDRHPPEPPEEPSEEPLLTLEEVEHAYNEVAGELWESSPAARIVAVAIPQMIEQLRNAQDRLRPARREYTVTDGDKPAEDAELVTAEQADLILRNNPSKAVWGRDVHPGPWEYISAEPPF